MSSALTFIPRKVSKPATQTKQIPTTSKVPQAPTSTTTASNSDNDSLKYDEIDYVHLLTLSLSDYALWSDPDLRQMIGIGVQPESDDESEPGFVSLNDLFETCPILYTALHQKTKLMQRLPGPSSGELAATRNKVQVALSKGIRKHASHLYDIRMLLHDYSVVPRFGKQREIVGGYEVKRKKRGIVIRGKAEWDLRSIYLENIPPKHRSYAGLVQFLLQLLHDAPSVPSSSALPLDPFTRIQGILFPLHHKDKPDTIPSCKGFAVVTFANSSDCEYILQEWPWTKDTKLDRKSDGSDVPTNKEQTDAVRDANDNGLRVITKKKWLALKAEYLKYRQELINEINAHADSQHNQTSNITSTLTIYKETSVIENKRPPPPTREREIERPKDSDTNLNSNSNSNTINPHASYPPKCLVFVKNVHPETTKTTLRHLFSQAFKSQEQNSQYVDYVDFNKGMDTCYLRLATPTHTTQLVDHFTKSGHRIVQTSGMDECGVDLNMGTISQGDIKPITMECVTGKREEIYWEKVPMKVRKVAVEKAIKMMNLSMGEQVDGNGNGNVKRGRGGSLCLGGDVDRDVSDKRKKRRKG